MNHLSAIASRSARMAMDSTRASIVKDVQRAMRDRAIAQDAAMPYVGELRDAETAEDVYRATLIRLGVPGAKTMAAEALPHVLKYQPLPGTAQDREIRQTRDVQAAMAADAAAPRKSFEERFPGMGRLLNR